jgi:dihydrofolate reductase
MTIVRPKRPTRMTRTVLGSVVISLDGFTAGPDPSDMSWLGAHAVDERSRAHFAGIYSGATTALVGRTNFEGFTGFWTPLATDPTAHPRDRAYARWQLDVEKVVFSRTLTEVPGPNARLAVGGLADEVSRLKKADGGDIIVLSSSSLIRGLLEADLLDELHLLVAPVVLGSGLRFWPEGGPRTDWDLASVEPLPSGAVYQTHRRRR